jgi:hypothetical protein
VPGSLKGETTERRDDRTTGKHQTRSVDCWDVGGRVDGIQWLKRARGRRFVAEADKSYADMVL